MSIVSGYELTQMVGDPDDHRPGTWWAVLADPGEPGERVDDLVAIVEHIGVGEGIPLHVHRVSEVIFAHGPGEQRLGDERRRVADGDVVFIPQALRMASGTPGPRRSASRRYSPRIASGCATSNGTQSQGRRRRNRTRR